MCCFSVLPGDVIRHEILPYLDSLDILALRYTCKLLKYDTRSIPTYISDAKNRSTKYWSWIYSRVECWCYECQPMKLYIHWLTRIANPRTARAFFNSHKYRMIVRHCNRVTNSAMLGACARGDLRIAALVRGSIPFVAYNREEVLYEACKHQHTRLFSWLVDIGDIPKADSVQSYQICMLIGEHGNLIMLRSLMARGFEMDVDHWWLVAIGAMKMRHDYITRLISVCAPNDVFSYRFLLASITYDNTIAFRVCLERGTWPMASDSEHLRLYNARNVARQWYLLDMPILPTIRLWIESWLD
jgi:hypothetical protein